MVIPIQVVEVVEAAVRTLVFKANNQAAQAAQE
jgi:hypothetical protein